MPEHWRGVELLAPTLTGLANWCWQRSRHPTRISSKCPSPNFWLETGFAPETVHGASLQHRLSTRAWLLNA